MDRRPWHPFRHPGWCGVRGSLCFLFALTLAALPIILRLLHSAPEHDTHNGTQLHDNDTHTRLKRDLFFDTPWEPWKWDNADYVGYNPWRNSWWAFLRWSIQITNPGSSVLAAISLPTKHDGLFILSPEETECTDIATDVTFYYSIMNTSCKSLPSPNRCMTDLIQDYNYTDDVTFEYTGINNTGRLNDTTLSCIKYHCQYSRPFTYEELNYSSPLSLPFTFSPKTTFRNCYCNNGGDQFLGISKCNTYLSPHRTVQNVSYQLMTALSNTSTEIGQGTGMTLTQFWHCGNHMFAYLPADWRGCCVLLNHTITNVKIIATKFNQHKQDMATFTTLESYHLRISLSEKWGKGLLPWYGGTFSADHIDNIPYLMSQFANETIKGFKSLSTTQRSHRLTLLRHEMALDFILATTGGLCVTPNFTRDACVTFIPDSSDSISSIITVLETIEDAFGPSDSAGYSFNKWLSDKAILVRMLISVLITVGIVLCFCACALTFVKTLMYRWICDTVSGQLPDHLGQYVQLIQRDSDAPDIFLAPDWILPFHDTHDADSSDDEMSSVV